MASPHKPKEAAGGQLLVLLNLVLHDAARLGSRKDFRLGLGLLLGAGSALRPCPVLDFSLLFPLCGSTKDVWALGRTALSHGTLLPTRRSELQMRKLRTEWEGGIHKDTQAGHGRAEVWTGRSDSKTSAISRLRLRSE